ncbi:MAG: alpha/beta fold hydrolase [Terriglobia bacterium]
MDVAKPSASSLLLLLLALLTAGCESRRPVQVPVDGEMLAGIYWQPPKPLSAALLLLPGAEAGKEDWIPLAERLQRSGYAVLAVDLRGPGAAGEATRAADIAAAFAFLRDQKRVDAARLALIGAGGGADGALRFSAREPSIHALVLLSPLASEAAEPVEAAMAYYGWRPVLLAAGRGVPYGPRVERLARRAPGTAVVQLYDSAAQGIRLLYTSRELERAILDFLDLHLRSPVLDTSKGGD